MVSDLQLYSFRGKQVRTVQKDGATWFVALDVARVLGYGDNTYRMLDNVSPDEQARFVPAQNDVKWSGKLHGKQTVVIINESGLYSAVLRSRLPEAQEFRYWVTNEVLPTIRRTGSYSVKPTDGGNMLIHGATLELNTSTPDTSVTVRITFKSSISTARMRQIRETILQAIDSL